MPSSSSSRSTKDSDKKRTFTINKAYHVDGCPTKFSHKDYTGVYKSHSSQRAAEKALTELCRVKEIHGRCTLYIEMRETTQGSDHQNYAYHCKRIKLKEPVTVAGFVHHYKPHATRVRIPTEKCKKSHKSRGRMRLSKHKVGSKYSRSSASKKLRQQSKRSSSKKSSSNKNLSTKKTSIFDNIVNAMSL